MKSVLVEEVKASGDCKGKRGGATSWSSSSSSLSKRGTGTEGLEKVVGFAGCDAFECFGETSEGVGAGILSVLSACVDLGDRICVTARERNCRGFGAVSMLRAGDA